MSRESNDRSEHWPMVPFAGRTPVLNESPFAGADDLALAGPSPSGPSGGVLRAMLRHKLLISLLFVLLAGSAAPAIWLLVAPQYESTATVRVAPVGARIVFSTEFSRVVPQYHTFLNTQVSIIRSPKVLERVLDRPEVRNTSWYKEEGYRWFGVTLPPIERLSNDLIVRPRRDTELIDVTMATLRPKEAKVIVDAVVFEYNRYTKEKDREDYLDLIDRVSERHKSLAAEIKGLEDTRYSLVKGLGLTDSPELRNQLGGSLSTLEAEYGRLERELAVLKLRRERLNVRPASDDGPQAKPPDHPVWYAADPEWRGLRRAVADAEGQLTAVSDRYGPSHQRVRDQKGRVEAARAALHDRESQIDDQRRAGLDVTVAISRGGQVEPATIVRELEEKESQITLLKQAMDQTRGKLTGLQEIGYYDEQVRRKQQDYEDVRRRLIELETEAKAPGRIEVNSTGLQSTEPRRDRRALLSILAIGAAAMVSLAVGYFRGTLDSRIHGSEDVQRISPAPFLGRLPLLRERSIHREIGGTCELPLFSGRSDRSVDMSDRGRAAAALTEGMRVIRTSLLERLNPSRPAALLVTSPTSRVGKSSVSVLLAKSLAAIGRKVLLVEANFYSPCLSSRLGLDSGKGLAWLLSSEHQPMDAIQRTTVPLLDVLPLGEVPDAFDAEALADGRFGECIAAWKKHYDFVVVDSSPLLLAADPQILARKVDGALMVVRASQNRRKEAEDAYSYLSAVGARLLGVVLIGGKPNRAC